MELSPAALLLTVLYLLDPFRSPLTEIISLVINLESSATVALTFLWVPCSLEELINTINSSSVGELSGEKQATSDYSKATISAVSAWLPTTRSPFDHSNIIHEILTISLIEITFFKSY